MENTLRHSKVYDIKVLLETIIVLLIMLGLKYLTDVFQFVGAGSLGIWSGIICATLFMRIRKAKWVELGLSLPKDRREWLVSMGIAIITVAFIFLFIGLVLDPLLSLCGLEKSSDAADRFTFFLGKPFVFIGYMFIVVWIGAALGEELLMRGYLLNRLSDFIGKTKPAWFVSILIHSIIFGMLHSYQGTRGIITTGFIALVFGTVYMLTKKRLFPVILAHLLINTITLTAFYISGGEI